jgi:hypothetical protein
MLHHFFPEIHEFFRILTGLSAPAMAKLSRYSTANPVGAIYHGSGAEKKTVREDCWDTSLGIVTMTGKRTIRITVERDRVWIIRLCGSLARTWCDGCAAEVEFVSMEQATALTGRTSDEIRRSVLVDKLHTTAAGGNAIRICLRSLLEGVPVLKSLKAPGAS